MKIAAFSPVYNEESLIKGCIESFRGVVDRHIILLASQPFYGTPSPSDRTKEIAESLGATVVSGNWKNEPAMRNCGNLLLRNYDWILVNDADMWWQRRELYKLLETMRTTTKNAICSPQLAYWYDTNHVLVGDGFCPVTALRPNVRWHSVACVNCDYELSTAVVDHLNWCAPKDILKKVQTYSHANEYTGAKEWWENNWVGWQEGSPAIMPDGKFFDVAYNPLPQELRKYLVVDS
jgi:glycosyltransferase involved in cell wall biosynthesis